MRRFNRKAIESRVAELRTADAQMDPAPWSADPVEPPSGSTTVRGVCACFADTYDGFCPGCHFVADWVPERNATGIVQTRNALGSTADMLQSALYEITPFEMVREFHAKVGQPDSDTPDVSPYREMRLRLIDEERHELGEALAADDVVAVADALADLLYVVIGSALQWGIPLDRAFAEVHRSNMTKGDGGVRADGKILKGPGYSPPDLSFVLAVRRSER